MFKYSSARANISCRLIGSFGTSTSDDVCSPRTIVGKTILSEQAEKANYQNNNNKIHTEHNDNMNKNINAR